MLRSKRESGQYCVCPPYGYRKDQENKHRLAPDEMTAPVVGRIFKRAAGDSSRKIAVDVSGLLALSDREIGELAQEAARRVGDKENLKARKMKSERGPGRSPSTRSSPSCTPTTRRASWMTTG